MILLTAQPKTGKTTAIHKIVDLLGIDNCGGFYTEEIRESGERVGFKIETLSGKKGILSHINIDSKYRISKYGVDVNTFEKIGVEELKNVINDSNIKYIIIDEIGPMELYSEEYKRLLLELLNTDKPVIGTIFKNSYPWLDEFKKQDGIELIEVTLDNRDLLPYQIVSKIKSSKVIK